MAVPCVIAEERPQSLLGSGDARKEAEVIQFGSDQGGHRDDELQIALKRDEDGIHDKEIKYFRRKTRTMLLRHWPKVDHVAKALLAVRTLTSEQIEALVAEKITPREREIAGRIEAARKRIGIAI
jgi:hypothetical protein